VAVLKGLLYAVCELSPVVHVFDTGTKSFERLEDIKVPNMDDPNDIAVCTTTNELFIADCRIDKPNCVGCIWKVTPSKTMTRWMLRGGMSPYSLSIRKDRILVIPLHSQMLLIFGTEQRLKRKIVLPGRMEPRHAVETEHRTVIVCHWGRRIDGSKVFQIGEFDGTGQNLKVFSATDDLNDFAHMRLDPDGRLLVVDSWKSCVLLLNKNLQLERILVQNLDNNPYRLFYAEQTGHLFIGESVEHVKVYNVSYPPSSTANHVKK